MTRRDTAMISRRALVGGMLAGAGQAAWGAPLERSLRPAARPQTLNTTLAPSAGRLIEKAGLSGKTAYVVANARSGRILESYSPLLGLPPASVAKTITAEYAFEALGPAHAFATRLVATAPLVDGRIEGDLILLGGGDPTLDTNALAEMAAALKSTGLVELRGRFLVSGGAMPHIDRIDPGQPDYLGYNPAICGLNLNFNRVHFEWKKTGGDYAVTMEARSDKYRPAVAMTEMEIVERRAPVYTYANGGRTERWTVARAALGGGGARWLPVRMPEFYAGEVFQTFARSHGIVLGTPQLAEGEVRGQVLVERHSPPLAKIIRSMLEYSTNMVAEVSGLSASLARGARPDSLAASGAEMAAWMRQRLGARKPHFVDHSGLGDATRLTPTDMAQALIRLGPDSTLASVLKTIPLRDARGNLRQDSDLTLRAKTGTLNFASGLAGFLTVGQTDLAFAIFSADVPRRDAIPVAARERPPGARGWNAVARRLQWSLLDRWAGLYG